MSGKIQVGELQAMVDRGQIDTVVAAFPDLYGRLVGKRFSARHFAEDLVVSGTHACDYLLTVDIEMEPVDGYQFANWETGYGDFHLVPDFDTLRCASWLPRTAIVLCDLQDRKHQPIAVAPRSLLRRQVERAAKLGFVAKAGSEAEYYLYRDSFHKNHRRKYQKLRPVADYIEDYHILQSTREEPFNGRLRNALDQSAIPVECTKGEWGCGQHELNLRYAEILEMADRHVLYKQCAKEIADSLEMSVTFMAKPHSDQAGSSCHVHLSLWQGDSNVFDGTQDQGGVKCSDTFRWFLGGWIEHAAEVMVLMAPNVNSYKRFQTGSWAPTRIAWARDNRTAGFRVVGDGSSLRIECRLPGADCNPYLVYAAALAAGLDGIEQQTEPPPMLAGNVYEQSNVTPVPPNLSEATKRFEQSSFVVDAFGRDVVEHYVHFFQVEQAAFDRAVTDWERHRYFERI